MPDVLKFPDDSKPKLVPVRDGSLLHVGELTFDPMDVQAIMPNNAAIGQTVIMLRGLGVPLVAPASLETVRRAIIEARTWIENSKISKAGFIPAGVEV